jgi:hypothetical protein
VSENFAEKRPIPMFWGQGEAEPARCRRRGKRLGLKPRACTLRLPTARCWWESKPGFKMEIPDKTEIPAKRSAGLVRGFSRSWNDS